MNGSVKQDDLLMSLNKIKSYIDNNVIELKVSDDGTKIYYKLLADIDNWILLLDITDFTVGDINKIKKIELRQGSSHIEWRYEGDPEIGWQRLVKLSDLKGRTGATFKPLVSEDGILSWENEDGLINPPPVNIKGEAKLPDNIEVITNDIGPTGNADARVYFNKDKSKLFFEFDLVRGKNGSIRTSFYNDLATNEKNIIDAINELVGRINVLEQEINDLKNP